jgi:rubrerythrin
MTTAQYVVATHNLNRTNDAIKVSRETWMASAPAFRVRVCMQCGYTGDFTHIYNGAHPECPMCEGD